MLYHHLSARRVKEHRELCGKNCAYETCVFPVPLRLAPLLPAWGGAAYFGIPQEDARHAWWLHLQHDELYLAAFTAQVSANRSTASAKTIKACFALNELLFHEKLNAPVSTQ